MYMGRFAMKIVCAFRCWIVLMLISLTTMASGTPLPGANAAHHLATTPDLRLKIPFIHQYFNDPTSADCGPASLAMVLDAYGKRPAAMQGNDKAFLKAIRDATGKPDVHAYTGFDDLTQVLKDPTFQITYTVIPKGTDIQTRELNLQLIKDAVAQRKPVVMFINSNTLKRGYGGHWVVVTGFSGDGQYVFVNDPDLRTVKRSEWDPRAPGGQARWPYDLFKEAANAAGDKNYAIVIGDGLPDTAVVPAQLGEIGGIVRDSAGQGVANATVILTYGQGEGDVVKTDFTGQYVFHNIPADTGSSATSVIKGALEFASRFATRLARVLSRKLRMSPDRFIRNFRDQGSTGICEPLCNAVGAGAFTKVADEPR
jgi:uncharacterized protein YvpB